MATPVCHRRPASPLDTHADNVLSRLGARSYEFAGLGEPGGTGKHASRVFEPLARPRHLAHGRALLGNGARMAASRGHDIAAIEEGGYTLPREAVPPEKCRAAVDASFAVPGTDPGDPEDWHWEPHCTSGFVELCHHRSLSGSRQEPRTHEVLARPRGEQKLRVPVDRDPRSPYLDAVEARHTEDKQGGRRICIRAPAGGHALNTSDTPRFARYSTVSPAGEEDRETRQQRMEQIERRMPPPSAAFPGEPRGAGSGSRRARS